MPGYRSGAFGKWHLTLNFHQCLEHPVDTGLDEYALTYDLARGNHRERYWGSYWTTSNNPGKGYRLPEDRFVDDEAVAAAQVFIDRSQSKSEPWFCNLAFTLTHAPLVDLPGDQGRPSPSEAEQFRRMVTYLDKLCGEMFDFLRARNLYDDTLIVFMSDNGGIRIAGGEKGDLSELGISIPYIMRYPKMIEEGREGRLTQLADLFMTLTHVAGKPIERRYAKDQASLFVNGDREIHQYQYASTFEYNFMIADRRWKLRTPPACRTREEACRRLLLFDLDSDPFEQSPIRPQLEAGSEMRQALEAYVRLEKLAKRAGLI
jgi:arylsulfatase A-like enzyme